MAIRIYFPLVMAAAICWQPLAVLAQGTIGAHAVPHGNRQGIRSPWQYYVPRPIDLRSNHRDGRSYPDQDRFDYRNQPPMAVDRSVGSMTTAPGEMRNLGNHNAMVSRDMSVTRGAIDYTGDGRINLGTTTMPEDREVYGRGRVNEYRRLPYRMYDYQADNPSAERPSADPNRERTERRRELMRERHEQRISTGVEAAQPAWQGQRVPHMRGVVQPAPMRAASGGAAGGGGGRTSSITPPRHTWLAQLGRTEEDVARRLGDGLPARRDPANVQRQRQAPTKVAEQRRGPVAADHSPTAGTRQQRYSLGDPPPEPTEYNIRVGRGQNADRLMRQLGIQRAQPVGREWIDRGAPARDSDRLPAAERVRPPDAYHDGPTVPYGIVASPQRIDDDAAAQRVGGAFGAAGVPSVQIGGSQARTAHTGLPAGAMSGQSPMQQQVGIGAGVPAGTVGGGMGIGAGRAPSGLFQGASPTSPGGQVGSPTSPVITGGGGVPMGGATGVGAGAGSAAGGAGS